MSRRKKPLLAASAIGLLAVAGSLYELFRPSIIADYLMEFLVTGSVVDASTGQPISGAEVRFTNPQNGVQWSIGTATQQGHVDLNGGLLYGSRESEWQFRFGDLPDFPVRLEILKENYRPVERIFQYSQLPDAGKYKRAHLGRIELQPLAEPKTTAHINENL